MVGGGCNLGTAPKDAPTGEYPGSSLTLPPDGNCPTDDGGKCALGGDDPDEPRFGSGDVESDGVGRWDGGFPSISTSPSSSYAPSLTAAEPGPEPEPDGTVGEELAIFSFLSWIQVSTSLTLASSFSAHIAITRWDGELSSEKRISRFLRDVFVRDGYTARDD
jgi:hypothetical protein